MRLVLIATLFMLTACEGTWATPSIFPIGSVHESHVKGLAMVQMTCVTYNAYDSRRCSRYGSTIQVQFPTLHDARAYVAEVHRGKCGQATATVARIPLYANTDEPNQGSMGSRLVGIPIHQFLKDGYSVGLSERRGAREVACGNLISDRFF